MIELLGLVFTSGVVVGTVLGWVANNISLPLEARPSFEPVEPWAPLGRGEDG